MLTTKLQVFLTATFLTVALGLAGCGGGSGATGSAVPAGSAVPIPLAVFPGAATMYYGIPTEFTILGGEKNYSVFSSHPAITINAGTKVVSGNTFIVTADNVVADTPVTLTVADARNSTVQALITVKPASLFNSSLKVTPDSSSSTCSPAICSGGTGLVGVQLQFGSIAGHNVRLEVLQGDYLFVGPAATGDGKSLTVTTDTLGAAFGTIKANTNAPTQYAILKATDLANGSSQQTTFVIAQNTSGAGILSVVPDKYTLTNPGLSLNTCSSGVYFNYYVFGGTPPYRIVSTNTLVATVSPGSVSSNGGGFTATTAGSVCGDVTFAITDATGRTTTATLTNSASTTAATPPAAPATLVVAPATATMLVASKPQTLTFNFAGGTAPYTVSTSNPLFVTTAYGGGLSFTASSVAASAAVASNTVTLTVLDSAGKSATSVVTFQ